MATTTAGALKAAIDAALVGCPVYRDAAPEAAALPYVVVHEGISIVPALSGDHEADPVVSEQAQIDVWQRWRDPTTNAPAENVALPRAVARAVHAARLSAHPQHAWGSRLAGSVRFVERDTNLVHHALTVDITRDL
ncbi:MAG: hypothetical protein IPM45_18025 [Acidimicrobiales bacterium]|nr:hypothetical protein [Acidimicrobiales bacterium]